MTATKLGFLADLFVNPSDEGLRGIAADFFEDAGDVEVAELLRSDKDILVADDGEGRIVSLEAATDAELAEELEGLFRELDVELDVETGDHLPAKVGSLKTIHCDYIYMVDAIRTLRDRPTVKKHFDGMRLEEFVGLQCGLTEVIPEQPYQVDFNSYADHTDGDATAVLVSWRNSWWYTTNIDAAEEGRLSPRDLSEERFRNRTEALAAMRAAGYTK